MKKKFCQILISATTEKEANAIAEKLLTHRYVAGTFITKGDSKFWWKRKLRDQEYYNISCFSTEVNKLPIIKTVKEIHSDEIPIISFNEIDGNREFLEWIEKSVR